MKYQKHIPIHKIKLLGYIFICFIFIVGGIFMFFAEPTRRHSPLQLKLIGGSCVLFFGVGVLVFLWYFFFFLYKGLILSKKGITNRISPHRWDCILWEDISNIWIEKVSGAPLLFIEFHAERSDFYLKKSKNPFFRNRNNNVVSLPIGFLKIKADELERILYLSRHGDFPM